MPLEKFEYTKTLDTKESIDNALELYLAEYTDLCTTGEPDKVVAINRIRGQIANLQKVHQNEKLTPLEKVDEIEKIITNQGRLLQAGRLGYIQDDILAFYETLSEQNVTAPSNQEVKPQWRWPLEAAQENLPSAYIISQPAKSVNGNSEGGDKRYQYGYSELLGYRRSQEDALTMAFINPAHLPESPEEIGNKLQAAYSALDTQIIADKSNRSGCTASTTVYDGKESLITATLADACSFVAVYGQAGNVLGVLRLNSVIHTPSDIEEKNRIEAAGGNIIPDDQGTLRVQGAINITRALGDSSLKPYLTSNAAIKTHSFADIANYIKVANENLTFRTIVTCDGFTDASGAKGNNTTAEKEEHEQFLLGCLKTFQGDVDSSFSYEHQLANYLSNSALNSGDNISVAVQTLQPGLAVLCGVYDGHGGVKTANYVAENIVSAVVAPEHFAHYKNLANPDAVPVADVVPEPPVDNTDSLKNKIGVLLAAIEILPIMEQVLDLEGEDRRLIVNIREAESLLASKLPVALSDVMNVLYKNLNQLKPLYLVISSEDFQQLMSGKLDDKEAFKNDLLHFLVEQTLLNQYQQNEGLLELGRLYARQNKTLRGALEAEDFKDNEFADDIRKILKFLETLLPKRSADDAIILKQIPLQQALQPFFEANPNHVLKNSPFYDYLPLTMQDKVEEKTNLLITFISHELQQKLAAKSPVKQPPVSLSPVISPREKPLEKPQITQDTFLVALKAAITTAQENYAKHTRSLKTNTPEEKRGEYGFFTRRRHNEAGVQKVTSYFKDLKNWDLDTVQENLGKLCNDNKTRYNRHSFTSYLFDQLSSTSQNFNKGGVTNKGGLYTKQSWDELSRQFKTIKTELPLPPSSPSLN